MPNNEPLPKKMIRKVMTMSLADLSNPDFVCSELLIGRPTSPTDDALRGALEFRKLLEDMKATRASRHVAVLALCVAVGSMLVLTASVVVAALNP